MGWFDPVSGAGADYAPIFQQPVAAPVQEAAPIDIAAGAKYRQQKRVADALRRKADAAAKTGYTPFSDTIVSEGVNGAPGQVQVNYGGILANALTPWLNQRGADQADEKAAAAEDEAQAAHMEALKRMQAGMPPEQMVQLGAELGDETITKLGMEQMFKPPEDYTKQYLQYGTDLMGMKRANSLAQMKGHPIPFSPEIMAEQEAAERQKVQDEKAIRAAGKSQSQGRAQSDYEIWKSENPQGTFEQYREMMQRTGGKSSTGGAAGGRGAAMNPAAARDEMINTADQLQALIDDPKSEEELFSWMQSKGVPAVLNASAADSSAGNPLMQIAGQYALGEESPSAAIVRRLGTLNSFDVVKALYPASNSDVALARSLGAKAGQSKEAMQAYINHMRYMAATYPIPEGYTGTGAPAGASSDANPDDALLNKYAPR